jgi:hypothetical protein
MAKRQNAAHRLIGSSQSKQQRDIPCGLSFCPLQENSVWLEQREGDQADNGGYDLSWADADYSS